jgi:polyvinyl alcohol dehydrogenase (cytochrome)
MAKAPSSWARRNGNLYVLSTQAGALFWATSTSPDGNVGVLVWGIAVDDSRVYYPTINSNLDTWTIQPSNWTITNSAFGAMGLASGAILWETPSPGGPISAGRQ